MGLHIFANHAHVFPESLKPDGTITRLLQLLDACDIERAVAFAPLAHQCDGTNIEPNRWVASELKNQPRLSGFGTIDLRRTDVREQVKHARELGLLGLKLHPNAQKFDILSPRAMELY
ncbi:MAG: hypothetical protein ACREJC_06290, partial [Tepidisphaeraceae bacterium]